MDDSRYAPAPTAARFQSGTPPVPSVYAGLAGLRLIEEAEVERTAARIAELTDAFVSGLDRAVVTPESRGALVCVESEDPAAEVERLAARGVITSWRDRSVRVSFHFYNDERDVEAPEALGDGVELRHLGAPRGEEREDVVFLAHPPGLERRERHEQDGEDDDPPRDGPTDEEASEGFHSGVSGERPPKRCRAA